jgi:hypothetical protein
VIRLPDPLTFDSAFIAVVAVGISGKTVRLAVISDIHSNLEALTAVLAAAHARGDEKSVVLRRSRLVARQDRELFPDLSHLPSSMQQGL